MYTITTTSRHLSLSHGDPKRDSRTAHRSCSQSAPSAGEGAASPLLSSCVMFGTSWAAHARARPRSMSRHDWPRRARMSVLIHQVALCCGVAWARSVHRPCARPMGAIVPLSPCSSRTTILRWAPCRELNWEGDALAAVFARPLCLRLSGWPQVAHINCVAYITVSSVDERVECSSTLSSPPQVHLLSWSLAVSLSIYYQDSRLLSLSISRIIHTESITTHLHNTTSHSQHEVPARCPFWPRRLRRRPGPVCQRSHNNQNKRINN